MRRLAQRRAPRHTSLRMSRVRSPHYSALRRVPGLVAVARALRELLDPDQREIARLRRSRTDLFQPFPSTRCDRHPTLFKALALRLAVIEAPEILSFGCASGEEVRTLRALLPHARMTGIDPNRRAIAKAREADSNRLSSYIAADRPEPQARYDAVLALAVFRHGALRSAVPPASCADLLPFSRIEAGIARLDEVLRPGGWLALANSQFRLEDTAVADRYGPGEVLGTGGQIDPLYGPDNRLIEVSSRPPVLYRKLAG